MPISQDTKAILASRKAQVIRLLGEGKRVKDIAAEVSVTPGYVSQIANMLGIRQYKAHLDFRGLLRGKAVCQVSK